MTPVGGAFSERFDPDDRSSPEWGAHRSRYHFAAPMAAGKVVVDVASGTGYGAEILRAHGAAGVLGFDLSWDGLLASRKAKGLFCSGDGTRLPLRDGSIEFITSFETLEHIARYEDFVRELARILAPAGTLVLSTPNALVTKPVHGKPNNPFHIKEFLPDELRELLSRHFGELTLLAQRPHPRSRPCPYWEHEPSRPGWSVAWKIASRLPASLRDRLWRTIRGVSFYPQEHDWVFVSEQDDLRCAQHLVAVCRK